MTPRKLLFLLSAIVSLGLSQTGLSQTSAPGDPVIRVTVDLVVVDAQVVQKKTGRPIGSLTREDFELLEDGIRQEIVSFSQDQLPLSIVFLFDLTESVRPVLKPLASGALHAQTLTDATRMP